MQTSATHRSKPRISRSSVAIGLACGIVGLTACEMLIGLEDRKLAPDGSVGEQRSPLCETYCTNVMNHCTAERGVDAFSSLADCRAVCEFLPAGPDRPTATSGNSVSCRAHYALEAANAEADADACPAAAVGGSGTNARCGDGCEVYCGLHKAVCPDKEQTDCITKCRAIPDRGAFSAQADAANNDTLQCRLWHLTAAARAAQDDDDETRIAHCEHSLLRAGVGLREFCDLPGETEPNCADYCKLVGVACRDHKVYANNEQCMKTCAEYPKGTIAIDEDGTQDSVRDTLACRRWHAYFALDDDAETHCPHAGPTGDGHCGETICKTYCAMLRRGCPDAFNREFAGANSDTDCESACGRLRGVRTADIGYDLSSEEVQTDTVQCRTKKIVEAISGADTCEDALPSSTCR